FLGRNRSPASPAALGRVRLSGQVRPLCDPCAAIMVPFEAAPGEESDVVFFLGQAGSVEEVQKLLERYRESGAVEQALDDVQRMWDENLGAVQIRTPDRAFDLM